MKINQYAELVFSLATYYIAGRIGVISKVKTIRIVEMDFELHAYAPNRHGYPAKRHAGEMVPAIFIFC
jgi:hypothetical protein